MGATDFYGVGKTIDTSKPFTVITEFITNDGTDSGDLIEIRRKYVQNGVIYNNPQSTVAGINGNSLTSDLCDSQKSVFGERNEFKAKGGLKAIGDAFSRGMVLVFSIDDDFFSQMLWLDSAWPTDFDPSMPGITHGECPTTSGAVSDLEVSGNKAYVKFSNIKVGPIDGRTGPGSPSTTTTSASVNTCPGILTVTQPSGTTTVTITPPTVTVTTSFVMPVTLVSTRTSKTTTDSRTTTTTETTVPCAAKYAQCGGQGWVSFCFCWFCFLCK